MRSLLLLAFITKRGERFIRGGALRFLKKSVPDKALRANLKPTYSVGCKRILISDDYFPAIQKPNVSLVTEGVVEVRERSVVDAAGNEHEVDAIVFATGFNVTDPPMSRHVFGRDGRSLTETWNGSMTAHVGTTIPGFPNFFLMQGPNTGLGHSSVIDMIEAQIEHTVDAVKHIAGADGVRAIEPTQAATTLFVDECMRKMRGTVWVDGGCSSWYLDKNGRNSTLWPSSVPAFRKRAPWCIPHGA
jgi:cation diffusion facilitator CzcD-associated flavoprotein CzcO